MVGLERTNYTVSEDDSEVEVCVVIKSECNVPFPFYVVVSTKKGPGMCIHTTFIGAMLHCSLFSVYDPTYFQEISDSPKILKFEAHVKKSCINININDDVFGYDDEVFIISISLQSISGLYSGIRLLTNEARVDVTGELMSSFCIECIDDMCVISICYYR